MAYFCRFMCGSLSGPIWILTPFYLLNCSMGGVKVFLFLKFERFRAEGETHVLKVVGSNPCTVYYIEFFSHFLL